MSSIRRARRVQAGVSIAAIATFSALLSHIAAGGAVPGWVGIVVPFAASSVVSTATMGKKHSLWRVGVVTVVSQLLFHALFVLGSGGGGGVIEHHHGSMPPAPAHTGHTALSVVTDPVMALCHVLAAVMTAGAVMWGSLALGRARTVMRAGLRRILLLALVPQILAIEPVRMFAAARVVLLPSVPTASVGVRGPPLVA